MDILKWMIELDIKWMNKMEKKYYWMYIFNDKNDKEKERDGIWVNWMGLKDV